MNDLITLVKEGGVSAALIVSFVLCARFIRYLVQYFTAQNAKSQAAFQDQVKELAANFNETVQSSQRQMQLLLSQHMQVSKETIGALRGLQETMRTLQEAFRTMERRLDDDRRRFEVFVDIIERRILHDTDRRLRDLRGDDEGRSEDTHRTDPSHRMDPPHRAEPAPPGTVTHVDGP